MSDQNIAGKPQRYVGVIAAVHSHKTYSFAWIDRASIMKVDGSPGGLDTNEDVFVHSADSDVSLKHMKGKEIEFEVRSDLRRGDNTFRAYEVGQLSDSTLLGRLVNGGILFDVQGVGEGRILEHPSVFVSWCFKGGLAEDIKKCCLDGKRVAKLLVISGPRNARDGYRDYRVDRQLVDINDPMLAVNFMRPGENRIVATVVFGNTERELRKQYLKRNDGGQTWSHQVLSSDGLTFMDDECLGSGCVDVVVPEELFARKPRDWDWVNELFSSEPRDQCAFRRRRFLAYTIQPVLFGVFFVGKGIWGSLKWLLMFVMMFLALSVGMRGINYQPLRHPLREDPVDVWKGLSGSVFIPKAKGKPLPLFFVFSPVFLAVSASVWYFREPLGAAAGYAGMVLAVIAGVLLLVTLAIVFSQKLQSAWDNRKTMRRERRAEKAKLQVELQRIESARYASRLAEEIKGLTCDHAAERTPDVARLPMTPKNFRFHASALKRKVCRGFAS